MNSSISFWLSRAEVRDLDRRAIEEFGVPGMVLMENAGRGAAVLVRRLNPEKKPVVILCGPGNNGGDGFVMARHLENHGWPVRVILFDAGGMPLAPPANGAGAAAIEYSAERLPEDARRNFEIIRQAGLPLTVLRGQLQPATTNWLSSKIIMDDCWIVDALFGTGLNRALAPPYDEIVAMINAGDNPVLAIDIPSGLDCDTGEAWEPTVKAAHTATFVAWKKGFFEPAAEPWLGEVHIVDIGAPKRLIEQFRRLRLGGAR